MPPESRPSSPQHPWDKAYPKDLLWDTEIPPTTMVALFDDAVQKYQDRPALNFMGKKISYKKLGAMVDSFAKGLQDQGIGKESKVGLCLPNTPYYVIAYHAALKAGATVVNFNPLYAEKEMENQIKDSGVDMMVTLNLQQILPKVDRVLGTGNFKKIVVCDMAGILPAAAAAAFRAFNKISSAAAARPLRFIFRGAATKAANALRNKVGVPPSVKSKRDTQHISFDALLASKGKPAPVNVTPDDLAVLQYTGGTTGVPKAAMLSQGNLAANTQQAILWFTAGIKPEAGRQEKVLAVLPFFHVFSMTAQMNLSLLTGSELIMLPKFEPVEFLKTVTKQKPTIFAGVPELYKKIAAHKDLGKYDISSLKICISGGAPLPAETLQAFKKVTGVDLVEGYGLSECSAAAIANPITGTKKPNSIGMPLPLTDVKIIPLDEQSEDGKTVGEIALRGPQIMQGYWNRPAETAEVMEKDGFMRTGDIGYIDDDGYVFIIGRTKDMIILNGLKVFPRKLEDAILKNDAVKDVSVIGVKNEKVGEMPKAFVVLQDGKTLTSKELAAFLKGHLADYEIPRLVEFRDALPLTAIGKPDKKALRQEEAEKQAAKKSAPPQPPRP